MVYGTTRVAGYLLDYDDFKSFQTNASNVAKGKGGVVGGKNGKQAQVTEYSASFIMGFSQGLITGGFNQIWFDKYITTIGQLQAVSSVRFGGDGQPADPFWAATHSSKAIGYSGTSYFVCANYILGPTTTLPNFSAEVVGILAGSAPNGQDCDPSQMLVDFASNSRYGAGFPLNHIDPSITNPSISGSYAQYVQAMGLWHSVSLGTQAEAQQYLDTITKLTNSEVVWSGGLLKIIPRGEQQVVGQITQNASWEITLTGGDQHAGNSYSITISDPTFGTQTVNYGAFANEALGDVGNELAGMLATIVSIFNITIVSVSSADSPPPPIPTAPNNVAIFVISMFQDPPVGTTTVSVSAASDTATLVVSTTAAGGVGTYTPNTMPIYSLGENDFIVQESSVGTALGPNPGGPALRSGATPITGGFNDDPVHVARTSPADAANLVRLECLDRGAFYNTTIVEVSDQAAIDQYGLRQESPGNARSIVDPYVGYITAQLLLQRSLMYRNTYTFQLGWKYILLEPMDLVQITDPRLGASALTVRITAVEEDDEGKLSITAEDFLGAYSQTVLYPPANFTLPTSPSILGVGGSLVGTKSPQFNGGTAPNFGVQVGSVNAPIIFEPPEPLLTSPNALEIWIALSNTYPNYGGAQVYMSLDGSSYGLVGQILGNSPMGVTTAALPAFSGPNPDIADTLAVDLTESAGTLMSVSSQVASNFISLLYVGGVATAPGYELLSYQNAALTTGHKYNLTRLYRGGFGSFAAVHPIGSPVASIGASIGRFPITSSQVGQTVHFKFLAFNGTGGGIQDLASVTAYPYTILGVGLESTAVTGSASGKPGASAILQTYVFTNTQVFPVGLEGSFGTAGTTATSPATFTIQKNGVSVGTMVFTVAATTAIFTMASATTFVAGDVLTIVAPSVQDATLANVGWTLVSILH